MIKFHQHYFVKLIPFENVNPEKIKHSTYKIRNLNNLENNLTRFQLYPETELACKYNKQLYKTQYSEILVEYEQGFDMNTGKIIKKPLATHHTTNDENTYIPLLNLLKNTRNSGGEAKPQDEDSTRLQELSLMNKTYFGGIHYDIQPYMKLDYAISRIFQEMSLSELETLHQLCELERTQILQSLALAVLKIPYAGYLLSKNRYNFLDYEGNILWYYTCTKKVSPLFVFEDKRCYKRIPIFYKNKVHFVDTLSRRTYFWDTAVPCGSENSHNVEQLNPDEDKYYLLTPYPKPMQPLKKFSPERIRAISRNPNINLNYRAFKRKFPNTPFPSHPGTAQKFVDQPLHTNTTEFLKACLPFFPQYTYFDSDPNDEHPNYVDEYVLYPTLSWTSFYHFSNPLSLPLYNTPHDNEQCKNELCRLTTH